VKLSRNFNQTQHVTLLINQKKVTKEEDYRPVVAVVFLNFHSLYDVLFYKRMKKAES
jgi:hypothetical protein